MFAVHSIAVLIPLSPLIGNIATSPAVLQSDDSIRAHRHGVVRDFTPTPSPSPDFRQSDQRSAGGKS